MSITKDFDPMVIENLLFVKVLLFRNDNFYRHIQPQYVQWTLNKTEKIQWDLLRVKEHASDLFEILNWRP